MYSCSTFNVTCIKNSIFWWFCHTYIIQHVTIKFSFYPNPKILHVVRSVYFSFMRKKALVIFANIGDTDHNLI